VRLNQAISPLHLPTEPHSRLLYHKIRTNKALEIGVTASAPSNGGVRTIATVDDKIRTAPTHGKRTGAKGSGITTIAADIIDRTYVDQHNR
jgi:hypothetical protein